MGNTYEGVFICQLGFLGGAGWFWFFDLFWFFFSSLEMEPSRNICCDFFFLIIFFMTEEDKNWVPFAGLICAVLSILNCNTGIILF